MTSERATFDRALADFSGDNDAERRLKEELRRFSGYLKEGEVQRLLLVPPRPVVPTATVVGAAMSLRR